MASDPTGKSHRIALSRPHFLRGRRGRDHGRTKNIQGIVSDEGPYCVRGQTCHSAFTGTQDPGPKKTKKLTILEMNDNSYSHQCLQFLNLYQAIPYAINYLTTLERNDNL